MAVTASWVQYKNSPPFNRTFDYIPFLPLDFTTNNLQVFGLKFQASAIDYVELLLQDEFGDIYETDGTTTFRESLLDDIDVKVARFWVYNVKRVTSADVGTAFGGVTYYNGPDNDGVGATLTATNNGKFAIGSFSDFVAGDKVLVKNQTTQSQNGIYEISVLGNSATAWVLTRVPEADTGIELKDVIVTNDETSTVAYKIDQSNPSIGSNITFTTQITSTASLESNLTFTDIMAKSSGSMVRFVLNKTPSLSPTSDENRSLILNKNFESYSYLFAVKIVKENSGLTDFVIRNLKLNAQYKTLLPETASRPVKIFAEPGFAVIRESMQVEYYLPTTTSDNLTYNVTNKTWEVTDKIEVYRQPSGGVRSVVSPTEFLSSGTTGNVTFLQAQNPSSVITVTISRPLTEQGI